MAASTIKIGLDSSDVDALIEKLERAVELATRLTAWPYMRHNFQARDYAAEPITAAERESDRKFFAGHAAPDGEIDAFVDGLTSDERAISEHLVAAVNAFGELERRHPSELGDFVDGIHACQNQLAWRIVQRAYPKAWPVKRPE
jgi:hypothetical protein